MKLIYALCIFGISFSLSAQKSDIETTFNNYIDATHSDDVSEQLEYFYPQMFDFVPEDQMLEGLKRTKETNKIKIGNEKLISISEIYEEEGGKYALLSYRVELTLNAADLKGQEGGEEAAMDMKDAYEEEHGAENVNFNEDTYVFNLIFNNTLYAILDNDIGSWKFLPKDETTTMITEEAIPEGIRAKL